MKTRNFHISSFSEGSLTIQFENQIDEDQIRFLHGLKQRIRVEDWPAIFDILVTFHEISVMFDPDVETFENLEQNIRKILEDQLTFEDQENDRNAGNYTIPVCYDEVMSWDRQRMEERSGLPFSRIISLHTEFEYLIYMFGFLPGFMYLGGLHEKLHCPRLEVPRQKVLPGSIGIAGGQTGIYPMESPGGWNIIGRTPLTIMNFDSPQKKGDQLHKPVAFQPLDHIRFTSISLKKFEELEGMTFEAWQKTREY